MDAVYGALALITFAMALGALLGAVGGMRPPSVGALRALAGRRVRVEREVATWSWAGDGGEEVVMRDGFEGELASVRLEDDDRELVLEFVCEDMDRIMRVYEPVVDSMGPVVSVWSARGDMTTRIWPAISDGKNASREG